MSYSNQASQLEETPSAKCYGAVREHTDTSGRSFDVWVITTDFDTIFRAHDTDTVLCDENELDADLNIARDALERLVMGKQETPFGCTMVVPYEEEEPSYRRRRYNHRSEKIGWRVLRWPLLLDESDNPVSLARVRDLCAEHGTVLVSGVGMKSLENETSSGHKGNQEALRSLGFVVQTSGDYFKFRWNALGAAMQDWRREKKASAARLEPYFTEEAISHVGFCVNPTNWPSDYPYYGLLSGKEDYGFNGRSVDRYGNAARHGSRGHRIEYTKYKIDEILRFIALNKKLCPKLKPWLTAEDYRRPKKHALEVAIEACFQNIHAVEERCHKDRIAFEKIVSDESALKRASKKASKITPVSTESTEANRARENAQDAANVAETTLKFCRWLRAQATELKIKVPPPPVLPTKPTKRSVKRRTS